MRSAHIKKKTFLLITASGNRSRGHTRPVTGEDTYIGLGFEEKTYTD